MGVMEYTPYFAKKMLRKSFKTVYKNTIDVILVIIKAIGLLEEFNNVKHTGIQLDDWGENLSSHKLDSWKIDRVVHRKVDSEFECAALICTLV